MNLTRIKPIYPALAAAVLGLLVMPIAVAGAAAHGPPRATANSTVTINQLEQQILRLRSRVGTLERNGTVPRGPAGGALQGSYPNPFLGPGAVREGNIGVGAVGTAELFPGSVNASALGNGAVNGLKLAPGAVSGPTLADAFAVQGPDQFVNAGHTEQTSVSCPAGSRLLSGGAEWSPNNDDNTAIISSSPSFSGDPNHTWVVQGRVDSGGAARDHLFAEALCLEL
jgi:hypothetical protein